MRILSRATLPVWSNTANNDRRVLGVNIQEVTADGAALPHDSAAFVSGFSFVEHQGERTWRWTDGDATLDVTGLRSLTMRILAQDVYPVVSKAEPAPMEQPQAA